MNLITIIFALITAVLHILFFIVESILWLNPAVHGKFLASASHSVDVTLFEQAQIMQGIFFNQGFYNLFIALGAIAGVLLFKSGKLEKGKTLVGYSCLMAFGASVVLASSSTAYTGALVQGVPPLLALVGMFVQKKNI